MKGIKTSGTSFLAATLMAATGLIGSMGVTAENVKLEVWLTFGPVQLEHIRSRLPEFYREHPGVQVELRPCVPDQWCRLVNGGPENTGIQYAARSGSHSVLV